MLRNLSVGPLFLNFQNYSQEIEKLDYLIERCRKSQNEHTFSARGDESSFIQPT